MGSAAMTATAALTQEAQATTSSSQAKIVIAGAGAAGLSLASRLKQQMPRATIVIIDAKKDHHFQPGFTLVGAGLWSPADVTFRNSDFMPSGIDWIEQNVAEFNPDANAVTTTGRAASELRFSVRRDGTNARL